MASSFGGSGPAIVTTLTDAAIPFGPDLFSHLQEILQSPPDSPQWRNEGEAFGINTVVLSLARYNGLKYVRSILPYYCNSENWRPVYLDEISAVFVRRRPQTQALIEQFRVDCASAPLPSAAHPSNRQAEFNRWANAASVLLALHRNQEAAAASMRALSLFSDSAALWYVRGQALLLTDHPREAEQALLQSAALEVNVATWYQLAEIYRKERRFPAAINALERLTVISPDPPSILMTLGYTYLESGRPKDALEAFDRTEKALPVGSNPGLAEVNNGRALAWNMAGDLRRATLLEEKAVALAPQAANYWRQLAQFYTVQGRTVDAQNALEKAATFGNSPEH